MGLCRCSKFWLREPINKAIQITIADPSEIAPRALRRRLARRAGRSFKQDSSSIPSLGGGAAAFFACLGPSPAKAAKI